MASSDGYVLGLKALVNDFYADWIQSVYCGGLLSPPNTDQPLIFQVASQYAMDNWTPAQPGYPDGELLYSLIERAGGMAIWSYDGGGIVQWQADFQSYPVPGPCWGLAPTQTPQQDVGITYQTPLPSGGVGCEVDYQTWPAWGNLYFLTVALVAGRSDVSSQQYEVAVAWLQSDSPLDDRSIWEGLISKFVPPENLWGNDGVQHVPPGDEYTRTPSDPQSQKNLNKTGGTA